MPTTISRLFSENELTFCEKVKWGELPATKIKGIYVVAWATNCNDLTCREKPNLCDNAIKQWIELVKSHGKNIMVDDKVANVEAIRNRLEEFWLPDETILYIGKAGPNEKRTIKKRLNEYYNTKLGCSAPHAGGNWIHTLKEIHLLNVYCAEYSKADILNKESQLISYFKKNVSDATRIKLFDQDNCIPFANKEYKSELNSNVQIRNRHGISNQTVKC